MNLSFVRVALSQAANMAKQPQIGMLNAKWLKKVVTFLTF